MPIFVVNLSRCFRENIVEISGQFPIAINQWNNNTSSVHVASLGNLHWKKRGLGLFSETTRFRPKNKHMLPCVINFDDTKCSKAARAGCNEAETSCALCNQRCPTFFTNGKKTTLLFQVFQDLWPSLKKKIKADCVVAVTWAFFLSVRIPYNL